MFFGRDGELPELVDLLIAERIVLLFSPSGAGKTSLIQAALAAADGERGLSRAAGGGAARGNPGPAGDPARPAAPGPGLRPV